MKFQMSQHLDYLLNSPPLVGVRCYLHCLTNFHIGLCYILDFLFCFSHAVTAYVPEYDFCVQVCIFGHSIFPSISLEFCLYICIQCSLCMLPDSFNLLFYGCAESWWLHGLFPVVASSNLSSVVECGFQGTWASVVVEHRLGQVCAGAQLPCGTWDLPLPRD